MNPEVYKLLKEGKRQKWCRGVQHGSDDITVVQMGAVDDSAIQDANLETGEDGGSARIPRTMTLCYHRQTGGERRGAEIACVKRKKKIGEEG